MSSLERDSENNYTQLRLSEAQDKTQIHRTPFSIAVAIAIKLDQLKDQHNTMESTSGLL